MTWLADLMAGEWQRLTYEHFAIIAAARRKGWAKPGINPLASAVFIEAGKLGVIADDVSQTHLSAERWANDIEGHLGAIVFDPRTGEQGAEAR